MKLIKKLLKKIFLFFLLLFLSLGFFCQPLKAQENKVNLYFFWANGCLHCEQEKIFLDKLVKKYPQLEIKSLEISNLENQKLWRQAAEKLNTQIGYTPFTVIGTRSFTGYLSDESTGQEIEKAVQEAIKSSCQDIFQEVNASPEACPVKEKTIPEQIKIPLLGEIKIKNLSLPLLTLVFGLLDGFNPCAMWVLIFLISLLMGMKNRKRMLILGTVFIFISGFVYFLFMAAWLNFLIFLGMIVFIRVAIGLSALVMSGYCFKDYLQNPKAECKVVGSDKKRKISDRLKKIVQEKNLWLALIGIIFLAFAVNLVELICSAGLPAVFTQILTLNHLPWWQYYFYLLVYIFFYILDDLVIFISAVLTMKVLGMEGKYSHFSRLVGGIIMLIIGLLLLFKPEWLMFA